MQFWNSFIHIFQNNVPMWIFLWIELRIDTHTHHSFKSFCGFVKSVFVNSMYMILLLISEFLWRHEIHPIFASSCSSQNILKSRHTGKTTRVPCLCLPGENFTWPDFMDTDSYKQVKINFGGQLENIFLNFALLTACDTGPSRS